MVLCGPPIALRIMRGVQMLHLLFSPVAALRAHCRVSRCGPQSLLRKGMKKQRMPAQLIAELECALGWVRGERSIRPTE